MSITRALQIDPIGVIHTPYKPDGFCPYQPVEREEGETSIELLPEYQAGLEGLETFNYIYVLYHMHLMLDKKVFLEVMPPWARGVKTGLFSTRIERRPVPIGLSVVKFKRIEDNRIFTSLIDVFDGTPLLDLKPYIRGLDSKPDANLGWIEKLDAHYHLLDHLRGIPHDHAPLHEHD